ncbi:hypothetical protein GOODEAATRI_024273, partial [Goodea atripinnis]
VPSLDLLSSSRCAEDQNPASSLIISLIPGATLKPRQGDAGLAPPLSSVAPALFPGLSLDVDGVGAHRLLFWIQFVFSLQNQSLVFPNVEGTGLDVGTNTTWRSTLPLPATRSVGGCSISVPCWEMDRPQCSYRFLTGCWLRRVRTADQHPGTVIPAVFLPFISRFGLSTGVKTQLTREEAPSRLPERWFNLSDVCGNLAARFHAVFRTAGSVTAPGTAAVRASSSRSQCGQTSMGTCRRLSAVDVG